MKLGKGIHRYCVRNIILGYQYTDIFIQKWISATRIPMHIYENAYEINSNKNDIKVAYKRQNLHNTGNLFQLR